MNFSQFLCLFEGIGPYPMRFYCLMQQIHTCTLNTRTPFLLLLLHFICCHCDEKVLLLKMEESTLSHPWLGLNDSQILTQDGKVCFRSTAAFQVSYLPGDFRSGDLLSNVKVSPQQWVTTLEIQPKVSSVISPSSLRCQHFFSSSSQQSSLSLPAPSPAWNAALVNQELEAKPGNSFTSPSKASFLSFAVTGCWGIFWHSSGTPIMYCS